MEATNYVIQINGVLSGIMTATGNDRKDLEAMAMRDTTTKAILKDRVVNKVVIVPNRLVNILTN